MVVVVDSYPELLRNRPSISATNNDDMASFPKYKFEPDNIIGLPEPIAIDWMHKPREFTHNDILSDCASGLFCDLCGTQIGDDPLELAVECPDCLKQDKIVRDITLSLSNIKQQFVEALHNASPDRATLTTLMRFNPMMKPFFEATLLRHQCEASLIRISDTLKEAFMYEGSSVIRIYEERGKPRRGWHRHCFFVLELYTGAKIAFDPTGKQYGPDWPVVQEYEKYKDDRMYEIVASADLGYAKKLFLEYGFPRP